MATSTLQPLSEDTLNMRAKEAVDIERDFARIEAKLTRLQRQLDSLQQRLSLIIVRLALLDDDLQLHILTLHRPT